MEAQTKKKEIVSYLLKNKVLVTTTFMKKLDNEQELETIYQKVQSKENINQIIQETKKNNQEKTDIKKSNVKIIFNYTTPSNKRKIQDFIDYYNARYKALEKILQNRQELSSLTSIGRLTAKNDRETVSIIGMIKDKQTTKNNNIILEVEDPTGTIKILASKNKPEICEIANNTAFDEVIGITGVTGNNIIFANSIVLPEIPVITELKKAPDQAYAIVISDIHVGSTEFLEEEFKKFISWIKGESGNEQQKQIAKKVKYIFIVGDLVDGVGIYPKQENELKIKDIHEQFKACAEYLKQIPSHIPLLICPGNHDPGRISEPQPPISQEYAAPLYEMKNVIMLSNPAIVNIHSSENFPGFNILMYHGYSFDEYAAQIPLIRSNGGYDRGDLIMKFLMQRRHLAPSHTSTLHIPDAEKDPLVIEKIPDFFLTGHIHKTSIANYRSITMICSSCWQARTSFQEKVGHHPEPCRVPIINLQTRAIKIMRF
ncbi:DNA-directed DNA polymerase II small subunit [Candidatus Woesearchaeota archaeon]|nr:DNA-directed DNA polymerase II small subunit [Candidatus Woesearchaeota archaeon]MBW2978996.1 DNA-directed DNA polymerase II small subunit [Candidatus Woesearchaeota archaeon]